MCIHRKSKMVIRLVLRIRIALKGLNKFQSRIQRASSGQTSLQLNSETVVPDITCKNVRK